MNVTHGLIFRKVSRTIPGRLQSDWVRCREPSLQASQDCTGRGPLSPATRGHPALSRTPFPSYARAPSPIKDPFSQLREGTQPYQGPLSPSYARTSGPVEDPFLHLPVGNQPDRGPHRGQPLYRAKYKIPQGSPPLSVEGDSQQ